MIYVTIVQICKVIQFYRPLSLLYVSKLRACWKTLIRSWNHHSPFVVSHWGRWCHKRLQHQLASNWTGAKYQGTIVDFWIQWLHQCWSQPVYRGWMYQALQVLHCCHCSSRRGLSFEPSQAGDDQGSLCLTDPILSISIMRYSFWSCGLTSAQSLGMGSGRWCVSMDQRWCNCLVQGPFSHLSKWQNPWKKVLNIGSEHVTSTESTTYIPITNRPRTTYGGFLR